MPQDRELTLTPDRSRPRASSSSSLPGKRCSARVGPRRAPPQWRPPARPPTGEEGRLEDAADTPRPGRRGGRESPSPSAKAVGALPPRTSPTSMAPTETCSIAARAPAARTSRPASPFPATPMDPASRS